MSKTASGGFSTITQGAKADARAVKQLSLKAKAQVQKTQRQQMSLKNQYGESMGGVIAQKYGPVTARVNAGAALAASRAGEARTGVKTLAQSNAIFGQEKGAMAAGQAEQMDLMRQNAQPGVISAQSAIASANSYAKRIGIDMKTMDWQAKGAVYQAIISQNAQMAQMQFQAHIDRQNMVFQQRLQTKAAQDAALQGAPAVTSAVNAAMPGLVSQLASTGDLKIGDQTFTQEQIKADPTKAALAWAATQTVDPTAATVLAGIATQAFAGMGSHIVNGSIDGDWLRGLVTSAVNTYYPGYSGTSEIGSTLNNGVLSSMLGAGMSPGETFGGHPNSSLPANFWHSFTAGYEKIMGNQTVVQPYENAFARA